MWLRPLFATLPSVHKNKARMPSFAVFHQNARHASLGFSSQFFSSLFSHLLPFYRLVPRFISSFAPPNRTATCALDC